MTEMSNTEVEIRSLGARLFRPATKRMIDEFDQMVSVFCAQGKISRELFMWAQPIVGHQLRVHELLAEVA